MSEIAKALTSASFAEAVALLLITAALTGFLVPIIKSRLDAGSFKRQQQFQAELARRASIAQAQGELLEVLADVLGGLRMLYTKVAFYAKDGRTREYRQAFAEFEQRSWDFLAAYRTQLSKANALTSPETHERMRALYHDVLIPTDRRLYVLVGSPGRARPLAAGRRKAWADFFQYLFGGFTDRIDSMLGKLAGEIRRG